ncbi:serine hydrolase domain-containing protein [Amycolatopsis pithecellobii]|uniref:Serine hydrolase n=1 Tax=Amycolatopsis pithecellobii TaxID=664692 RepID=A0A6N7ZC05_9PSEU|nr:serine hydrolase domain-containing protein [Amycolatopsis pithecellobii]MTD59283.1 serine hydrolase [Amycolatopsis pithecellobii]
MTLETDTDPAEAGFDASRLARIDRHFARYVDEGLLPGWQIVVTRGGKLVHVSKYGRRDMAAERPVESGTLWRIFSMTKPVTSVAAMMLFEEGAFELTDPISRWLPEFAAPRVYVKGSALNPVTEPATSPIRVWHLLSHTSGLTYGFHQAHPVDAMYRQAGFEWFAPAGLDLAQCVEKWAQLPLLFQPGSEWNYSVSTDVLGRFVEVVSGQSLDEFFAQRIFGPLGMIDTSFGTDDLDRVASMYTAHPGTRQAVSNSAFGKVGIGKPDYLSGGGGLVSTAADYHRFTQFLLRGGELDGARLLSPRTIRLMTSNHLPGDVDLEEYGRPLFAEVPYDGYGFGLGFAVLKDPVKAKTLSTPGEYSWGGAASTAFWIDPAAGVTGLFFTQLVPSSTHPIRQEMRKLVYQAMVEETRL